MYNRKFILKAKERRLRRRFERANEKELRYEMNPYNWNLVKRPDGKMKVVMINDKNENRDWEKDESDLLKQPLRSIIEEKQIAIDILEIKEGFPALVWKHCTFTKEEFKIRQENEAKLHKLCWKKNHM
jgi:hypothetical protein